MTRKKALLAGSSFSAMPILSALQDAGLHVTVAGNRPDDPCHAHGDASLMLDYADKDALLIAARGFDYLVPSCNDESYLACAHVAHALHLPGYDSPDNAAFIHVKDVYRTYLAENGFAVPSVWKDGDALPALVKPVDASGGKGLCRIDYPEDLPAAVKNARQVSKKGQIIIESFFCGTLHSHSAFLKNGEIHADFFADEFCTVYAYQVNCSNHPSRLPRTVRDTIRSEMTRMANLRQLTDGLLHTQFMTDGTDIRIIESMRRCPGDLYGEMIGQSTGFAYAAHYIAPFIGQPYPAMATSTEKPVGRHTVSVIKPVLAQDIRIDLPATRFLPLKTAGQRLDPSPYDKFGLLFIDYPDQTDMYAKTEYLANYVHVRGKDIQP